MKTVPCIYCGTPTPMVGTKLCDECYEVDCRLVRFLASEAARARVIALVESYSGEQGRTVSDKEAK